jgi:hypothetical protein
MVEGNGRTGKGTRRAALPLLLLLLAGLLVACGGGGGNGDEDEGQGDASATTEEERTTTTERETTTTTEPEPELIGIKCGGPDDSGLDGDTFTPVEVAADPPTFTEGTAVDLTTVELPQPDAGINTFELGYGVHCEGTGYGSTDLYGWMSPDARYVAGDIGDQGSGTERIGVLDLQTGEVIDVHGLLFDESGDFVETQSSSRVGFTFDGDLLFIDGDGVLYSWDPASPTSVPSEVPSAGFVREVSVEGYSLGFEYDPDLVAEVGTSGNAWPRGVGSISPNGEIAIFDRFFMANPGGLFTTLEDGADIPLGAVDFGEELPGVVWPHGTWVSDSRYIFTTDPMEATAGPGGPYDLVVALDFDLASGAVTATEIFPPSDGYATAVVPVGDGDQVVVGLPETSPSSDTYFWVVDSETLDYDELTSASEPYWTGYFPTPGRS